MANVLYIHTHFYDRYSILLRASKPTPFCKISIGKVLSYPHSFTLSHLSAESLSLQTCHHHFIIQQQTDIRAQPLLFEQFHDKIQTELNTGISKITENFKHHMQQTFLQKKTNKT